MTFCNCFIVWSDCCFLLSLFWLFGLCFTCNVIKLDNYTLIQNQTTACYYSLEKNLELFHMFENVDDLPPFWPGVFDNCVLYQYVNP